MRFVQGRYYLAKRNIRDSLGREIFSKGFLYLCISGDDNAVSARMYCNINGVEWHMGWDPTHREGILEEHTSRKSKKKGKPERQPAPEKIIASRWEML